jgi:Bacterial Ig domain
MAFFRGNLNWIYLGLTTALLTGCPSTDDPNKPTAAINAPAFDATLSSVIPIQVDATDDTGVARVEVFVRGRNSTQLGIRVGSAVTKPFVISWDTTGVPNNSELEIIAKAYDTAGNEGVSTPVRVKTQNANLPSLTLLSGYSLPPKPAEFASSGARTQGWSAGAVLPAHTQSVLESVTPPTDLASARARAQGVPARTLELKRDLALEWEWSPYQSLGSVAGADGYGIFLSKLDAAGVYERQLNQQATASGAQKFSKIFPDARVADVYWGCVTAVVDNRTRETTCSNADNAKFPPVQDVAAPANGATVSDGKPTLTWTATPGAIGYLYLVYDRNPWDPNAKIVWRNTPATQTTDKLAVAYPNSLPALPKGTYYWWISGVSFDSLGKADGFSFSDPRTFIVP